MPSRDDHLPDTPRDDGLPTPPDPADSAATRPNILASPWPDDRVPDPVGEPAPTGLDPVAEPAGTGLDPVGESAPTGHGFRISRPRHLRDDVPRLPPPAPLDARRAAARTGSTVPMPVVVDSEARTRRGPGRRTWLAAAAAVVVVAAVSFVLSTQRSGVGATDLDTRAGEPFLPPVGTQPWSAMPSASSPTATPTAGTTPRASRSLGVSPTPPAAAVVGQPLAGATITTAAAPTTPPPPVATTPAGPVALPIVPHTGTLKIATSGKCLDDSSSNNSDGNPIQVYPCNGTGAQVFSFGADGTLRVVGKCIKPATTSSGALVALRSCDSSTAMAWYFRSDKVIVNKASGKCLTDSGALTNNLPQTTIATCTGATNQQWTFT